MLGTSVNAIAIVLGAVIGILLRNGIKNEYKETIVDSIGLSVLIIGIMSGIKTDNLLLVVVSLVLGSLIGEIIKIENKLDQLGLAMEKKFGRGDSNFSKAFVTTSLIYCIGAMSIVGSLESGLRGNHEILFTKSILDGILSIILGSSLGIGVAFAAIPVFIYQGTITLMANLIKDIVTPEIINEVSAVGGILVMAIGLNQLGIKKIKIGNMLPAIILPFIYFIIMDLLVIIR